MKLEYLLTMRADLKPPVNLGAGPAGTRAIYDVTGGTLWVCSLTLAGYLFGNLPWVQTHLSKIIWALILVPGLIALYGGWKAGRAERQAV